MMKKLNKYGLVLSKESQKKILGGESRFDICKEYKGPSDFDKDMCMDYHALPERYKVCVLVTMECFF